jgi:mono/diheme cytochrome c family protein
MMKNKIATIGWIVAQLYLISSCTSANSREDSSIPSDPAMVTQGETAFLNKCSSCHNFYLDGIGPQLAGVTSDQSVSWIKNFIRDPHAVIESGDTTAQKLFKRYKTLMPSFANLPDSEVNALISFLHTKKKHDRPFVKEDTNDIKNPIPDSIRTSNLVVGVDSFTQIPAVVSTSTLSKNNKARLPAGYRRFICGGYPRQTL